MSNTSITFNSEASAYAELSITYPVRFWIYLISNILSIPCCLFVLYQFLFIRNLRESLSNHLLIVLLLLDLIYEFTSISFTINYYRLNGIWQITRPFSQIWSFLDYGMYATNTIIFAWCTIERHILIFHHRLLLNRQKRIVLHYIPLIGVPLYGLIYYSLIIFYPFCDYFYSQSTLNGVYTPCFLIDPILSKYDLIVNQIIPVLIIISFTLALFFRFQLQKGRLRQSLEWRKQRKLIIQVLSIFIIFSGFQFPWTILKLCSLFGLSLDSLGNIANYMFFFGNHVIFLFPFVCCGTLPDIGKKLEKILFWKKQDRRIVPASIPLNNQQNLNN